MAEFCWDCTDAPQPQMNDLRRDPEPSVVSWLALCEGCGFVAFYDCDGKRVLDPDRRQHRVVWLPEWAATARNGWAVVDGSGEAYARYPTPLEAVHRLYFERGESYAQAGQSAHAAVTRGFLTTEGLVARS